MEEQLAHPRHELGVALDQPLEPHQAQQLEQPRQARVAEHARDVRLLGGLPRPHDVRDGQHRDEVDPEPAGALRA